MADVQILKQKVEARFATQMQTCVVAVDQLTIEVAPEHLRDVCQALRDEPDFHYDTLLDVCGVDYLDYGVTEWTTDRATLTGFERGVDDTRQQRSIPWTNPRFAVVYHLLSVAHNHRLRLRTFVEGEPPIVNSVIDIWPSANWYEREAFDLYGIVFEGHPDLRRILTDYGFIGHPFRKDFPLSGNVEVRYDAALGRVIYEPVQIVPRVLVPKVIRFDNRYETSEEKKNG